MCADESPERFISSNASWKASCDRSRRPSPSTVQALAVVGLDAPHVVDGGQASVDRAIQIHEPERGQILAADHVAVDGAAAYLHVEPAVVILTLPALRPQASAAGGLCD